VASAAKDAAAATVAPLLQLKRAAQKSLSLARYARAVELFERALAAAELAQPRDSLVIALLDKLDIAHCNAVEANPNSLATAERVELGLRSFLLLHARWQAGTLFAPTAEETAYLAEEEYPYLPAQMCGAFFYVPVAELMADMQVFPPRTPAEAEARVRGVCGALRAALETDARGMLERNPRTGQAWSASAASSSPSVPHIKSAMHRLVTFALSDEACLLLRMRAACGLTAAEETALRRLAERLSATAERARQRIPEQAEDLKAEKMQAAAADVARHGLRRCALPACHAQEPHPKLFKLCGRCRGAAYCCAAHSVEDWKRHKREDGCKRCALKTCACVVKKSCIAARTAPEVSSSVCESLPAVLRTQVPCAARTVHAARHVSSLTTLAPNPCPRLVRAYRVPATRSRGLQAAVACTACYCEPALPVSAAKAQRCSAHAKALMRRRRRRLLRRWRRCCS
jgi:hypothetical protein